MSNWCEVPDDTQPSETLCSNCGSNCGVLSSNGTCSICIDNIAAMEEIAAIDTDELYASQNDFSSVDGTQNVELAADGSAYVGDGAFSVSNFFEITYRCDITDPIKEFVKKLIFELLELMMPKRIVFIIIYLICWPALHSKIKKMV